MLRAFQYTINIPGEAEPFVFETFEELCAKLGVNPCLRDEMHIQAFLTGIYNKDYWATGINWPDGDDEILIQPSLAALENLKHFVLGD